MMMPEESVFFYPPPHQTEKLDSPGLTSRHVKKVRKIALQFEPRE